jgi:MFS family permease
VGRHRRRVPLRRASYADVLSVREFRWLWLAQVQSAIGDQFAQVAIAILVYHRTGSPFLTALAYALTYLPPILGGPLLSGLADILPRREVMITCDLVRAITVGFMAVPSMPFWGLCVLLFCTVLVGAPFSAARMAVLPDILGTRLLPLGSALGNITHQASQILGFVTGAAVVAVLQPRWTLAIDAATFGLSALIIGSVIRWRPVPRREGRRRPTAWSVTGEGVRIVFGNRTLRTLLLFGWLAGFYIVPEGLAAPYARHLGGSELTVGLLMAAIPLGTVIGGIALERMELQSQLRVMGWMAMGSCAPLIGCVWDPPLWAVLVLWLLAGMGGAFQLAAAPAFVSALNAGNRASAFGVAQSGLYAVQGLGILGGGVMAQLVGVPLAVSVAGLLGLCTATRLTVNWARPRLPPVLRLVDERLDDRGVLVLLGEDGPGHHVDERAEAPEEREHPKQEPDEGDVNLEVGSESGADPGHQPPVLGTDQLPAPVAAVDFAHGDDHAHPRGTLSSGFLLLVP